MGGEPMEQSWRITACKGCKFLLKAYYVFIFYPDFEPSYYGLFSKINKPNA